jgi:hypothetical protein
MKLAPPAHPAFLSRMEIKAILDGKVRAFRLSPVLARLHRKNAGKTMTDEAAIAFVETKRREKALRLAKPYLAGHP